MQTIARHPAPFVRGFYKNAPVKKYVFLKMASNPLILLGLVAKRERRAVIPL
ncbi:hypothetical protein [uncultured Haemophilus sp.]|jgi:hypothetical protein|uniref:hypothetical protein n=1 Tax=uncultured Haemophilus sp. TaxID=237779 RepID=UPI002804F822|nr:hypothetical protein [uncultured Haemophilus sp.]